MPKTPSQRSTPTIPSKKSDCWPMQSNSRNCASRPMMTSKAACGLRSTKAESAYD